MLIALHKPYGYLTQFSPQPNSEFKTLKEFGIPRGLYPIGRLDAESEGLLLLSDETMLTDQLLNPRNGHKRMYWAQVEGMPAPEALEKLEGGVKIGEYTTRPCKAWVLDPQPEVPPRDPPIRVRQTVSESWMALELTEGKNHQVRKMTASVGHPTLRLIRKRIGGFELGSLEAGVWKELSIDDRRLVMAGGRALPPVQRKDKPPVAHGRKGGQTPRFR